MVLDRPEIPLHTNGSENDIRCQVTRRKVSAGTRSDIGRDCRDAFLSLVKTCGKTGSRFGIIWAAGSGWPDISLSSRLIVTSECEATRPDGRRRPHFCCSYGQPDHGIIQ